MDEEEDVVSGDAEPVHKFVTPWDAMKQAFKLHMHHARVDSVGLDELTRSCLVKNLKRK